MKLYSENDNYKLYSGSMLDMLEVIEKESIDSIVTDPPYGLTSIVKRFGKEGSAKASTKNNDGSFARLTKGFMGKEWDGSGIEYNIDTWKKCYEVLKPGGYLLAFGGSRTFHRIACAIEDAGFEIRDTIMWIYGCLSNDTEILTSNGWKNSETITTNDEIYSLDLEKDIIIKNKCLNVFKYDYDGEMVNLKNGNTNQLLTPNHHCIVKDKIKTQIKGETKYNTHNYWNYKDAWQIRSQTVKLPLASNYNGKLEIGNLFAELLGWVISEGTYLKDTNAIMITQSSINQKYVERIRYILGKLHIKYNEYSRERTYKNKIYTEYDFYIGKEAEKEVNKIKKLVPNKKLNWGLLELSLSNKEFLIKGLLQGDGAKSNNTLGFSAFYQKDIEQLKVFQVLLHLTGKQGWINEKKYSCSIHNNPITELQGKHFKDRFVKYNGKYVWCIETEIGNFIAKRDGKIFITGNSGFPKSMNIGLAIDKKNGVDNRTGNIVKGQGVKDNNKNLMKLNCNENYEERIAQNKWQGWGTALKPSFEPIIVARKPIEGTVAKNCLKYGVGGINIDECRVAFNGDKGKNQKSGVSSRAYQSEETTTAGGLCEANDNGRFPANTILTYDETDFDEVCGGFPNTKGEIGRAGRKSGGDYNASSYKVGIVTDYSLKDSGSASRYFMNCKYTGKDEEIWKQLFVNNVENNLEILKAIKDNIVQMNVEDLLKELKNHYAKYVESQQDLIETPIVQDIVKMLTWDFKIGTSQVIQDFIINSKKCIQFLNLVQFVEKMDSIDTTQTTQNLLKLFGYVKVVITNYILGNIEYDQKRYIYTPKASKKDRDEGLDNEPIKVNDGRNTPIDNAFQRGETLRKNTHPTVKPTELMQYLVRLVSPDGATILDPFNGSGSTGKAVMYENKERNKNYKYIGIELTEEYLPISKARIEYVCNLEPEKDNQTNIFDFMEGKL